jgi:CHAD domain-containing protein
VIFGGPRRDVQIFPDGGAMVAETVVSIEQSCIIDLDDFSKKKQLVFLTAFLERLYEINREPLLLFLDEADRYASQKPMSAEMHDSLGASEDIARRGRKRGIGSTWVTQRYASLNKNVSDLCDLTVVFRTPGSRDLDELKERVGRVATKEQVAEVMKRAPGLEDGEAIFLSAHPKLRKLMPPAAEPVQLPMPWTFDSSATPGVGQRKREPKVLAKTDLAAIEERMKQQVERAKAEDPKALRLQVATLQREKAALEKKIAQAPAAKTETKVQRVEVLKDGQIARLEKLCDRIQAAKEFFGAQFAEQIERFAKKVDGADAIVGPIHDALKKIANPVSSLAGPDGTKVVFERGTATIGSSFRSKAAIEQLHGQIHRAKGELPAQKSPINPDNSHLIAGNSGDFRPSGPQTRILNTLATFEALGLSICDKAQVALFSDASPTSSTFANNVSSLRTAGLVDYPGPGKLALTEAGRAIATPEAMFASLGELHAHWIRKIGETRGRLLSALIQAYPNALTKEDLAAQAGSSATSSTFANNVSSLRTLGVVDYPDRGLVIATPLLFPSLP